MLPEIGSSPFDFLKSLTSIYRFMSTSIDHIWIMEKPGRKTPPMHRASGIAPDLVTAPLAHSHLLVFLFSFLFLFVSPCWMRAQVSIGWVEAPGHFARRTHPPNVQSVICSLSLFSFDFILIRQMLVLRAPRHLVTRQPIQNKTLSKLCDETIGMPRRHARI